MAYEIKCLRDNQDLLEKSVEWFGSKWKVPLEAYRESMSACLTKEQSIPQWYVSMEEGQIIGGLGVIENDFHDRKDLCPNVCAVYVEPHRRGEGLAGKLLDYVCEDLHRMGIDTLYLITDHIGFYERYGWEFFCLVQGDGEAELTRMYRHQMSKKINVEFFSAKYQVRELTMADVDIIYDLCKENTIYYDHCPPLITKAGVEDDISGLPPGKGFEDKYYVGFFSENQLIAVMDLIDGYPQPDIAFIGFFMTGIQVQGQGVGSDMIEEICDYLTTLHFHSVQLAWVKGNPQAENFWIKNQFQPIRESSSNVAHEVIVAERKLKQD